MLYGFFGKLKHIWNIEKTLHKETEELSKQIKAAKTREKTLHAATERDEQAADEHAKSLQDLRELQNRMPRGDSIAFAKLVVLCFLFYIILFLVYPKFLELIWDMFDDEYTNYIFHKKGVSFWTLAFRIGCQLTTWTWLSLITLECWPILWVTQRMLMRPHARVLIITLMILASIAFVVLFISPFPHLIVQISKIEQ